MSRIDPVLTLVFHGDTKDLLKTPPSENGVVSYPLLRRASIKDIIEALGVPHTEVGQLASNRAELTFDHIPEPNEKLAVFSLSPDLPVTRPTRLRPEPLPAVRFMVDINVGKLAKLLRMAGLDADEVPAGSNRDIAETAVNRKRILLTFNRDLLKQKEVIFGRLVRATDPFDQLVEVIDLYDLSKTITPFTRCMECNALLEPVAKGKIIDRLEPLTKKYYNKFKHCPSCTRIYWRGSHYEHMLDRLKAANFQAGHI